MVPNLHWPKGNNTKQLRCCRHLVLTGLWTWSVHKKNKYRTSSSIPRSCRQHVASTYRQGSSDLYQIFTSYKIYKYGYVFIQIQQHRKGMAGFESYCCPVNDISGYLLVPVLEYLIHSLINLDLSAWRTHSSAVSHLLSFCSQLHWRRFTTVFLVLVE